MRSLLSAALFALVAVFGPAMPANAALLASNPSWTGSATAFLGQSATVAPGGPFNNITFNFFDGSEAPQALGTLYIFDSEYLGRPDALSGAASLAASVSNAGGIYAFDPSVTLNGGQQYFFYADTIMTSIGSGLDVYSGGTVYFADDAALNFFANGNQDARFELNGTFVPEPVTLSLFGAGVIGLGVMRRRRKV